MAARWLSGVLVVALAAAGCDSGSEPDGDADGDGGDAGADCERDEDCADDHECTTDTCEEGHCRYTADHSLCDDGEICNGAEQCHLVQGCRPGEPVACDDGINCTRDECIPETGRCQSVPDDGLCETGYVCDVTAEGCVPADSGG